MADSLSAMAISASGIMPAPKLALASIPRNTPRKAMKGHSKRPAMNQARWASLPDLAAKMRWYRVIPMNQMGMMEKAQLMRVLTERLVICSISAFRKTLAASQPPKALRAKGTPTRERPDSRMIHCTVSVYMTALMPPSAVYTTAMAPIMITAWGMSTPTKVAEVSLAPART